MPESGAPAVLATAARHVSAESAGNAGGAVRAVPPPRTPAARGSAVRRQLADAAREVLRDNDRGAMTVAAPKLYPHQWSWDSAFIAVGLAAVSVPRAVAELDSLLAGQWSTGMLPQIVFGPADGYSPGPDVWRCHQVAAAAPAGARTSGICQPPVHAIAVRAVLDRGRAGGGADRACAEDFAARTLDGWLAWHRWLAAVRDPAGEGLVEIHHGWESGTDNSPRWDAAYGRVVPGAMPAFDRPDLLLVDDPRQRPSNEEYRRYTWLLHQLRSVGYDDAAAARTVSFRMADVLMSAILAAASEVLAGIGDELGRPAAAAELRGYASRFRAGVLSTLDPATGLARDRCRLTGEWSAVSTVAGFAPLIAGADGRTLRAQADLLFGSQWCGHPDLKHAVPPSTAPGSPDFRPNAYWRGPQWPVVNWLLWWALDRHGFAAEAHALREESLDQLADGSFSEYYHPLTGSPLGSARQSWTAAVALDWLS